MHNLWFFIKKLTGFRWQLLLGLFLTILLTASTIALMSLSGWFISAAAFAGLSVVSATFFNYLIPAGTIRFLALIRILSRYAERVINHDFTFKILTELRVWFYKQLIPLAPAHLMQNRSGDLLNRAVQDIDTLDHLYLRVLSPFIIAILTTIGVSIFIHFYSPIIALAIFLISIIAITTCSITSFILSNKIGERLINATTQLRTSTIDVIQGIIPLLFYTSEKNRLTQVFQASKDLSNAQKQMANLKGFVIAMMTLFSGFAIWLTLKLGIPAVNHLKINGAQLAMIMLCVIIAFEQLLTLPIALLSIGKTRFAAKRLSDIANQKPTVVFPTTSLLKNITSIDLSLRNICFQYPNKTIPTIKNISLDIPFGTKIAITGPSGAGKTTLAHLITRAWNPTAGEILLNNKPISSYCEADLRKYIAFTPQRVHIFNASIRDNLTLMNEEISADALDNVLALVDLTDTINSLPNGLKTQMGDFGKQFSGGQIRRIGIARALLTAAPIQIWDEPTTGLNDELLEKIWANCHDFLSNKTLIIITHDQLFLDRLDRIVHVEDGVYKVFGDIIQT